MHVRRTRDQQRRVAAGTDAAQIEDLDARFAADVEESVAERRAAIGLARGHGANEVLARHLHVAEVGDRVGGERLPAQLEHLRAETENAVRRLVEITRRGVLRHQTHRAIGHVGLPERRRGGDDGDANEDEGDP